jgi:hypothetical protein
MRYGERFFRNTFVKTLFEILSQSDFKYSSFVCMDDYAKDMSEKLLLIKNNNKQKNKEFRRFEYIYKQLFEILFNNSTEDIPKNWKITKQSWQDRKEETNIIVPIIFNAYIEFAREIININRDERNNARLESVTVDLFPDIDLEVFVIAVMLVINAVKSPRDFVRFYSSGLMSSDEVIKNTFELLKMLWPARLEKEKLEQSQEKLNSMLNDEKNSDKRDIDIINRIEETLEFISRYLKFLESK